MDIGFKDSQMNTVTFKFYKPSPVKHYMENRFPFSVSPEFKAEFKEKNPKSLLLMHSNFELLFTLMQQLDTLPIGNFKARIFSRNIWDIIQVLPTSTEILSRFTTIFEKWYGQNDTDGMIDLEATELSTLYEKLFPSNSNQKIIYSYQIVDYFIKQDRKSLKIFIDMGMLEFAFNLLLTEMELLCNGSDWTEWKQDCIASITHLIYYFATFNNENSAADRMPSGLGPGVAGTAGGDTLANKSSASAFSAVSVENNTKKTTKRSRRVSLERHTFLPFNGKFLALIKDRKKLMNVLLTILDNVSRSLVRPFYQSSIWSRSQAVNCILTFFISWCQSDITVVEIFHQMDNCREVLKKLILKDSDQTVRKETCNALLRLSLGSTHEGVRLHQYIPVFLKLLLGFIEEALINVPNNYSYVNGEQANFCSCSRDYFHLIGRLIERMVGQDRRNEKTVAVAAAASAAGAGAGGSDAVVVANDSNDIDLDKLCRFVSQAIIERKIYEGRKVTIEDEGLRGLLNLMTVLARSNPSFKRKRECSELIRQIFDSLFMLPTPTNFELPKCKAPNTRNNAFELLLELVRTNQNNYVELANLLMAQHCHELMGRTTAYPWEYWPEDEKRADCGFVGLTNLGATCYMATSMQHLFMLREARNAILTTDLSSVIKHGPILRELQRMFIFLQESERKAYCPRNFCKVYTMDHQPLNISEQKDMTEFFTDLITKLEDMTGDLKKMVKTHFAGTLSNNVVSLDCGHISQTSEEFYTLRCQVSEMKDLNESLKELTIKDTLEGDNMYNCEKCGKKVRAEKRACIKKLPKILCINTMRYTFNMLTMSREKVNTYFVFPYMLDMAPYLEKNLIDLSNAHTDDAGGDAGGGGGGPSAPSVANGQANEVMVNGSVEKNSKDIDDDDMETDNDNREESKTTTTTEEEDEKATGTRYELIGVTVHTGTADGGHYYSFIQDRDPSSPSKDKWLYFNDSEVKTFERDQLPNECYGGEMISKTYDQLNDKFLDFSFEKTNSAYMVFYERIDPEPEDTALCTTTTTARAKDDEEMEQEAAAAVAVANHRGGKIAPELLNWIHSDNLSFIRDRYIFSPLYFDFMWQVCCVIPPTLPPDFAASAALICARLGSTFVLETLIHAKEKPQMLNWIETLTKQLQISPPACEWLVELMTEDEWWVMHILVKCCNRTVRALFVRLCIHVTNMLKPRNTAAANLFVHPVLTAGKSGLMGISEMSKVAFQNVMNAAAAVAAAATNGNNLPTGLHPAVRRFMTRIISLINIDINILRVNIRFLAEYFNLLNEFSRQGDDELEYLLENNIITHLVEFYLNFRNSVQELDTSSEEEEFEDRTPQVENDRQPKVAPLQNLMILVTNLLERTHTKEALHFSKLDYQTIMEGKLYLFLQHQVTDSISPKLSFNIMSIMFRIEEGLMCNVLSMLFSAHAKCEPFPEPNASYFKLWALMAENSWLSPPFQKYVLSRIWEMCEIAPVHTMEWLMQQVAENTMMRSFVVQTLPKWLFPFMIESTQGKVRTRAAELIVALVPGDPLCHVNLRNNQGFRVYPYGIKRESVIYLNDDQQSIIDELFNYLLMLSKRIKAFYEYGVHGPHRLIQYFYTLAYLTGYIRKRNNHINGVLDVWQLFERKLLAQPTSVHPNKQAFMVFLYTLCLEHPETKRYLANNASIQQKLPEVYVMADLDETEIIAFNKTFLPFYFATMRMFCEASPAFLRFLGKHTNMHWAFKNISPYYHHYPSAVNEMLRLLQLFVVPPHFDCNEDDYEAILKLKRSILKIYLGSVDPKVSWHSLIKVFKMVISMPEDYLYVLTNGGLAVVMKAFLSLKQMFHEATACNINSELVEVLRLIGSLLSPLAEVQASGTPPPPALEQQKLHLKSIFDHEHMLMLLNTHTNAAVRKEVHAVLLQLSSLLPTEFIGSIAQSLLAYHISYSQQNFPFVPGPFFPKIGLKTISAKSHLRPPQVVTFQMYFNVANLDVCHAKDREYEKLVCEFYEPYYQFIEDLCRLALKLLPAVPRELVDLTLRVATESLHFHCKRFIMLWLELYNTKTEMAQAFTEHVQSSKFLPDYILNILAKDRIFLYSDLVYEFMITFVSKVSLSVGWHSSVATMTMRSNVISLSLF